jgi:hypothetical protein
MSFATITRASSRPQRLIVRASEPELAQRLVGTHARPPSPGENDVPA